MGADSRAAKHRGVSCVGNLVLGIFVKHRGRWESVGLVDFSFSETSHENKLSVPGGLENFTWGKLTDVEFFVGISDVSVAGNHLVVHDGENSFDSDRVAAENKSLHHVGLGALDVVVAVLFVPKSVFVEPIVNLCLHVERIAEVGGAGGCNPVHGAIGGKQVVGELLVLSFIIVLDNTEISSGSSEHGECLPRRS